MSESIYTREELKNLITESDIIRYGKQTTIVKNKISKELLEQIKLSTLGCRNKISEQIYWILNDIYDYPTCLECNQKFLPSYSGLNSTYRIFCCLKCMATSPITLKKKSDTYLERTGYTHPAKNPEVLIKGRQTYFERTGYTSWMLNPEAQKISQDKHFVKHGVRFTGQRDDVKEAIKQSNIENWGVACTLSSPIIIEKGRQSYFVKTRFYNCSENPKVQQLKIDNYLLKHGVEHSSQNPEVSERQQIGSFKTKELILETGEIIKYQGFENVAIIELMKFYNRDEIKLGRTNVPEIWFIENEKRCRYFPDIHLPKENLIIEVKSTYTYSLKPECLKLKAQACIDAGYKYQFWICSKKEILEIINI